MNKFTSRKFWMAAAAALGSLAGFMAGMSTQNDAVATAGLICAALSAAIYAAAEAYVDGKSAASSTVSTQINASTIGSETTRVVDTLLPVAKVQEPAEKSIVNE